jgi:ferredoxin
VSIRVTVDRDVCQRHGQCEFFAPEVFRLTDDMELEYNPAPDETLRDDVEEAARACPTQAIRVDGAL